MGTFPMYILLLVSFRGGDSRAIEQICMHTKMQVQMYTKQIKNHRQLQNNCLLDFIFNISNDNVIILPTIVYIISYIVLINISRI